MGRGTSDIRKMGTGALLCERRAILDESRGRIVAHPERLREIETELGVRTRRSVVACEADRLARLGRR